MKPDLPLGSRRHWGGGTRLGFGGMCVLPRFQNSDPILEVKALHSN